MFSLLGIVGVIASIALFMGMVNSDFKDPLSVTAFFSMLFSTIICFKLARMDQKIKDNESEIQKLKKHLGIEEDYTEETPSGEESYDSELGHIEDDGNMEDFEISDDEKFDTNEKTDE